MSEKAFVISKNGNEIATAVCEVEESFFDGDVTISVTWTALNFKDAMATQPGNAVIRRDTLIGGVDLAGVVVDAGSSDLSIGQEVICHCYGIGVSHHGGFSTFAKVPAAWVVPMPTSLTARSAMIIGTAGFTAQRSIGQLERNGLTPESGPVLVTGATGGVGSMAVSMLAAKGYEVTASTGKAEEHAYLRELGASAVISRHDISDRPERTFGAERWAGAVDVVGGETLVSVLRSLRYGASVAASGLTGGNGLSTTVFPFIVRGVNLLGIDAVETPLAERIETWNAIADIASSLDLERMVHAEIGLHEITGALEAMLGATHAGRTLVDPTRS